MTTEVIPQTLAANVPAYFGQGRMWFLKSASGPVNILATRSGAGATNIRRFNNIPAGVKFKAELGDGFDQLTVTSPTAQIIELIVGDDDVEVSNAVTVNGSVMTAEVPSVALSTPPRIATNITTDTLLIAQNLARRRVTIQNPASNDDAVNIGASGDIDVDQGLELEPGMSFELRTTAAVYARAVTNTPSVQVIEET